VADFSVAVRPAQLDLTQPDLLLPAIVEKEVGYGVRSDTIEGVDYPTDFFVCIRARTSLGQLRPWKPNQCQIVVPAPPTQGSPVSVPPSRSNSNNLISNALVYTLIAFLTVLYL
jgi:hypothetical protein